MRNHYDLGRRTDHSQPSAPEPEDEAIDFKRRRFPLWITVFISSLLLGIGTVTYAVNTFNSSSSPPGDTVLRNTAGSRAFGESTGINGGLTHGEGEKTDTPPVWEDFPADPNPVFRDSDKSSDTQKPKHRQDSTTRKTGGKKDNLLFNRPPSLPGIPGKKKVGSKPALTPTVPKDFTTDPPSYDRGDSENPAPTFQNLRVVEGYPFWKAAQVGKARTGDVFPDEVNLFGYELQPDGSVNSVTKTGEKENAEDVRSARRTEMPAVPIVSGDFVSLHDLLADPEKRTRTADNLMKWAVDRNFDGIDILFVSVDQSARENLSLFLEELAEKLHKEEKRLGVHIHPEMTVSFKDWTQWAPNVDQWKMIARLPVGKDSDMEEFGKLIDRHLTLLKSRVPKERVYLVLPLHGDPGQSGENPFFLQDPARAAGDETGTDEDSMMNHYQTFIRNILENHTDIGGIHLWYLGESEDPKIREMIRFLKVSQQKE